MRNRRWGSSVTINACCSSIFFKRNNKSASNDLPSSMRCAFSNPIASFSTSENPFHSSSVNISVELVTTSGNFKIVLKISPVSICNSAANSATEW